MNLIKSEKARPFTEGNLGVRGVSLSGGFHRNRLRLYLAHRNNRQSVSWLPWRLSPTPVCPTGPCSRAASARSRCRTPTPPAPPAAGTADSTRPIRRAESSGPEGRTPEDTATPPRTDRTATSRPTSQKDTVSSPDFLHAAAGVHRRRVRPSSRCPVVPTEQRTTVQGQVYFLHTQTGVSTWHDPRIPRYANTLLAGEVGGGGGAFPGRGRGFPPGGRS